MPDRIRSKDDRFVVVIPRTTGSKLSFAYDDKVWEDLGVEVDKDVLNYIKLIVPKESNIKRVADLIRSALDGGSEPHDEVAKKILRECAMQLLVAHETEKDGDGINRAIEHHRRSERARRAKRKSNE